MQDTSFTVESITREGVVTIVFSKALRVPRGDDKKPNFSSLNSTVIFAVFEKNSVNDYAVNFKFEPLEFDLKGKWCTLKLQFDDPLYVSLGDYPDKVTIYFLKSFFLYQWFFQSEVTEKVDCYNCRRLEQFSSPDWYSVHVPLPQLIDSSDASMLNLISQYTSTVLKIAFFGPVALSLLYNFPTYMVWILSNLLQIMEIFSYLRVSLPGNVI